MSFDLDMANTIRKYLAEVESRDLTTEEILRWPRWERVWVWWKALERYEGKPKSVLSLDEVKKIYGE